jgi:hypothetical protein
MPPPHAKPTVIKAQASRPQPLVSTAPRRRTSRCLPPMARPTNASAAKAKPSSAKAVIIRNCNSTWLAASFTSPNPDPRNRNETNTACNRSDRTRMSPLTFIMLIQRGPSNTCAQSRHAGTPKAARQNHSPSAAPDHSARKVAMATPWIPQPSPSTNHRSSAIFSPFIHSCTTSTARVRSCAISQPVIAYIAIAAGADQTRIPI